MLVVGKAEGVAPGVDHPQQLAVGVVGHGPAPAQGIGESRQVIAGVPAPAVLAAELIDGLRVAACDDAAVGVDVVAHVIVLAVVGPVTQHTAGVVRAGGGGLAFPVVVALQARGQRLPDHHAIGVGKAARHLLSAVDHGGQLAGSFTLICQAQIFKERWVD